MEDTLPRLATRESVDAARGILETKIDGVIGDVSAIKGAIYWLVGSVLTGTLALLAYLYLHPPKV